MKEIFMAKSEHFHLLFNAIKDVSVSISLASLKIRN